MIEESVASVSALAARRGFRKAGIFPYNPTVIDEDSQQEAMATALAYRGGEAAGSRRGQRGHLQPDGSDDEDGGDWEAHSDDEELVDGRRAESDAHGENIGGAADAHDKHAEFESDGEDDAAARDVIVLGGDAVDGGAGPLADEIIDVDRESADSASGGDDDAPNVTDDEDVLDSQLTVSSSELPLEAIMRANPKTVGQQQRRVTRSAAAFGTDEDTEVDSKTQKLEEIIPGVAAFREASRQKLREKWAVHEAMEKCKSGEKIPPGMNLNGLEVTRNKIRIVGAVTSIRHAKRAQDAQKAIEEYKEQVKKQDKEEKQKTREKKKEETAERNRLKKEKEKEERNERKAAEKAAKLAAEKAVEEEAARKAEEEAATAAMELQEIEAAAAEKPPVKKKKSKMAAQTPVTSTVDVMAALRELTERKKAAAALNREELQKKRTAASSSFAVSSENPAFGGK